MSETQTSILVRLFAELLPEVGTSKLTPSAYDTAWVARVPSPEDPARPAFPEALAWLSLHQLEDGSWGEGEIPERILATLAAVIALSERGARPADSAPLRRGLTFLWRASSHLSSSAVLPVGFELLLGSLLAEAEGLGLDLPPWLGARTAEHRAHKLTQIAALGEDRLRETTVTFSLECLGTHLETPAERFVQADGSVGVSPSATASVLRSVRDPAVRRRMLDYLARHRIGDTASAGWLSPTSIDLFEIIWVLYDLELAGLSRHPELRPLAEPHARALAACWRRTGAAMSSQFAIDDSDDTALAFTVLHAYGIEKDASVMDLYWRDEYFLTYPFERDPSLSTNIHALELLRCTGDTARMGRLLGFLHRARGDLPFWSDKWHASPYYPTCHAVIAAAPVDRELVAPSVAWIVRTQREDGSFGHHAVGTSEETAYAIQGLVAFARHHGSTPALRAAVRRGAAYLRRRLTAFAAPEPPLWISKNRYTPLLVVRAAVLSALVMAEEQQG